MPVRSDPDTTVKALELKMTVMNQILAWMLHQVVFTER